MREAKADLVCGLSQRLRLLSCLLRSDVSLLGVVMCQLLPRFVPKAWVSIPSRTAVVTVGVLVAARVVHHGGAVVGRHPIGVARVVMGPWAPRVAG